MVQLRLIEKKEGKIKYNLGPYNKYDDKEQWIRITEGCPHNCPYCYEPGKIKIFDIPKLVRRDVKVMDMNLLCKKEAVTILHKLHNLRINQRVIYFDFVCGFDYRYVTPDIAKRIKACRVKKIRIAWDWYYTDQFKIKEAINCFFRAGYKPRQIMIFMICNWKIPYEENLLKLDLCKVWGVQVADCYFDGQAFPNVFSRYWTDEQNKAFRKKCRKHNQLVSFGIDPQIEKKFR